MTHGPVLSIGEYVAAGHVDPVPGEGEAELLGGASVVAGEQGRQDGQVDVLALLSHPEDRYLRDTRKTVNVR